MPKFYDERDFVMGLSVGQAQAKVYEVAPKQYEVQMNMRGQVLDTVSTVMSSLREGKAPELAKAWEEMRQSAAIPVRMNEKDVADLMKLVDRTEDLMRSLKEKHMTPDTWYEKYLRERERERTFGIERG